MRRHKSNKEEERRMMVLVDCEMVEMVDCEMDFYHDHYEMVDCERKRRKRGMVR